MPPIVPSLGANNNMAPNFSIEVEGQGVDYEVAKFVESVDYESADGLADVAHIRAINPDFAITDRKVFQPGNEMAIYMGYGSQLEYVGRVIIKKQVPNFPASGMPTVSITGYTKDTFMMDNEPEKPKENVGKRSRNKKKKEGRIFKDVKFSEAVKKRGDYYQMANDVDDTPEEPKTFVQKPGISDYEFVNGLANETGYVFWVDGDEEGVWSLHFRDPGVLPKIQDKQYTFTYNQGDNSTLLDFQPEFLIQGAYTDIEVVSKNNWTGEVLSTKVKEENDLSPDLWARGDTTGEIQSGGVVGELPQIGAQADSLTTASDVKLFFKDFSFTVKSDRKFQDQADLDNWAKQWYRRWRSNFVLSRGNIIGVGSLRARQVHKIEGVGKLYSGEYYFTKVKHVCSKDQGYLINFAARKMVP